LPSTSTVLSFILSPASHPAQCAPSIRTAGIKKPQRMPGLEFWSIKNPHLAGFRCSVCSAEHYALAASMATRTQYLRGSASCLAVLQQHPDLGHHDLPATAAMTLNHRGRLRHCANTLARLLNRSLRGGRSLNYVELRLISHIAIIARLWRKMQHPARVIVRASAYDLGRCRTYRVSARLRATVFRETGPAPDPGAPHFGL